MNIFVGNLSFRTTEQELQREFEAFGEVDSVKIIMDRETLKSRGFAFVEMRNQNHALAAIAGINGKELAGETLKVNEARPREACEGQMRARTGGGFGSRDRSGRSGFDNRAHSGDRDSRDGDASVYDSKSQSGGGFGNRDRGGRGPRSSNRSHGGRRSH